MRTILHLLLGLALAMAVPASADTLAQLHKSFMERYDAANQSRDDQLKKLDASYLAALERQVEKNKATGKLDAVIPFFDEVQAVKTAKDPLPELPATTPAELKQMRAKHAEARDKILKSHAQAVSSLATKMETALKTQEAELTKAGKIDEALAAKHMRESLEKDEGIQSAMDLVQAQATNTTIGSWRSLLAEEFEVTRKGLWDPFVLSRLKPEDKSLAPFVETLKTLAEKPDRILMAHTPSIIEFKLQKPVSQAKGRMHLANPHGSARFRILRGGKTIHEHLIDSKVETVSFEIQFEPTRNLTFEIDQNGTDNHDWTAWLNPEVR